MIEVAALLIVNALHCAGFYAVSLYDFKVEKNVKKYAGGLILGRMAFTIDRVIETKDKAGKFTWLHVIYNPLYNCLTCMASLHGALYYFWYFDFSIQSLTLFMPYAFALAGINTLISITYERAGR